MTACPINNRVTEMTATDYPIIQAPMGWIARAQLAAAVSNAGGLGIIETSSGLLQCDGTPGPFQSCISVVTWKLRSRFLVRWLGASTG